MTMSHNEIDASYNQQLIDRNTPYAPSNEMQLTTQQRVLNNIMIQINRLLKKKKPRSPKTELRV